MIFSHTSSILFRNTRSCYHVFISLVALTLILLLCTSNVYSAQATLSWNPNSESDLAGYKVYYGNSSRTYSQAYGNGDDAGNQTGYTISNLVEGEIYFFAATAYDFSGNESGYSSEVSYDVPITSLPGDMTPPSTPTYIQATVVSSTQIDIYWNASSDKVGVAGYKIYRNGIQIATTTGTSYQDTGLSPSTTYTYNVSAYDAAGNESGQSSGDSATTSLDVNSPPVLSYIGNMSVNEGQILSFNVSASDLDGDPLSYSASNLPLGASFSENTKIFTWTPTYKQAGIYSNINFQVNDGMLTDSQDVTVTVGNVKKRGKRP